MTKLSVTLILPLCLALAVACRDDSVGPELQYQNQSRPVFTRMEVMPSSIALLPAEWSQQLTIKAWDQFGATIVQHVDSWGEGEWWNKTSYVSSAPEIAEVNSIGFVRGVAPGVAEITTTLTLDGVTRTAIVTVTVLSQLPESVTVTVNQNGQWSPTTVDVKAGGAVTWVVPNGVQIRAMWLNVWEKNAEKLEFTDGRATRSFPTPGKFYYGTGFGLMWYEEGGLVQVY